MHTGNKSLYEGNLEKYNQIVTKISPLFILQGENVLEKSTSLEEAMKGKASAVTFAVIENGKVNCAGIMGKQSDDPNSLSVFTDTMFLTASLTKAVVAYCATQCLQEYAKQENIPVDKILDISIDKFFPKVSTTYPFTELGKISEDEITGTKAVKIIKEIYEKSSKNLDPVRALALIAQFKAWAIHNNRPFTDIKYIEELEREILQKHEFLYSTLEVREALQRFIGKGLTFRELLSHSTGIIVDPPPILWYSSIFASSAKMSIEHLRHAAFAKRKTPGTWRYSNTGYTLVECALESIMGQPLPEIMQKYVFAPLKMNNSTISQSPETLEKLDHQLAYWSKSDNTMNRHNRPPRGAGGMRTTAKDYATFMCRLIAVYNDSNNNPSNPTYNLAKEMFKQQKDCLDDNKKPSDYGLGIAVVINEKGDIFLTHQGGNMACANDMRIYPLTGQGAIVMVNNDNRPLCWQMLATIGREYKWTPDWSLETMVLLPIPKNQFAKFVGKYKMPEEMQNVEIVIFEDNGELKLQLPFPKMGSDPITFDLLEFKLLQEKDGVLAALGDKLGVKVVYYEPKSNDLRETIGINLFGFGHPPLIGTPISN